MPLVHTKVFPTRLSNKKLQLGKTDSEFIAVNNGTLVNVLHQLGSLVSAASQVFGTVSTLTSELGIRIRTIQLRLEELEVKAELFDPKLVPVRKFNTKNVYIEYYYKLKTDHKNKRIELLCLFHVVGGLSSVSTESIQRIEDMRNEDLKRKCTQSSTIKFDKDVA